MKKILLTIMLLIVSLLSSCDNSPREYVYKLEVDDIKVFSDELSVEKITSGVYVVNHKFPWGANSLIIELKNNEVLLIDTPYENEATRQIVEWIKSELDENVKITAINTGFHFDNLGGNGYLTNNGYDVFGTSLTVDMIDEYGQRSRDKFLEWLEKPEDKKYRDVYETLEYIAPNQVIEMGEYSSYEMVFDKEKIVLFYPEISHSPDNIVVYIEDQKILFGGCMVKALESTNLGNTQDADILGWINSIESVKSMFSEDMVDIVVPGHGNIGDYSLLEHTIELLNEQK